MKQFRISIGSLDMSQTESTTNGAIWGRICVENMECCFPEWEWYDAVSSLLDMWLSAIYEYVNNDEDQCELYFMDGPFVVQLNRLPENAVCVSFVERPYNVHRRFSVSLVILVSEILGCANSFVDACKTQAMYFTETNTFRRIVKNMSLIRKTCKTGDDFA